MLSKLQPGVDSRRQRLLTVGKRTFGRVLEGLERCVLFESASKILSGLGIELVGPETANEGQIDTSAAAESRQMGVRWRT